MLRGFKYRLKPSIIQESNLFQNVGAARFVYNQLLDDYQSQYNIYKDNPDTTDKPKIKEITFLKSIYPWMSDMDFQALANAKLNLNRAFTNFYNSCKGKRKGKKLGFPTKKKKYKSRWSYTTNNINNNVRLSEDNKTIKLPKIGYIPLIYHKPIPNNGIIKSVTVSKERDNSWYISILVDYEYNNTNNKKHKLNNLRVVGLDMSYTNFAVSSDYESDQTKAKYVQIYRKNKKHRARLNRSFSKRTEGSKNRHKQREKLAKYDRYLSNYRKDYCNKQSRYYANNYDVVVLEDINMQDISRGFCGGKSVSDLGFGMFREMLKYKCEEVDTFVYTVPKYYPSSKTCNCCGRIKKDLKVWDRIYECEHCGTKIDRDYNAALNLRDYFIEKINTQGPWEIYACSDVEFDCSVLIDTEYGDKATTLRETLVQVLSLKQEAPTFK